VPGLRERITDQFSARGHRSDVWGALDLVIETEAFLNLGYSPWYLPHAVGSSQRRLAARAGRTLTDVLGDVEDTRLLDVGAGRGGPSVHLAEQFGFDVTGVDLVAHNVRLAREHARATRRSWDAPPAPDPGGDAEFVVGDATALPIATGSTRAATALDALVYVPDRGAVLAELSRVLEDRGALVVSDLVAGPNLDAAARERIDRFAEAWDMARPATTAAYREQCREAGLRVLAIEDLTANSVGRFRTWSGLFLGLLASPAGPLLRGLLRRLELDPATVRRQVRQAHEALPHLGHVLVTARA